MLFVTEEEITACMTVVQDMLYMYGLLESLELKVKLPMLLEMDNSGAEDVANSWSVRDRTHHVDVQNYFLRAKQPGAVDDNTHTYKTGNFAM